MLACARSPSFSRWMPESSAQGKGQVQPFPVSDHVQGDLVAYQVVSPDVGKELLYSHFQGLLIQADDHVVGLDAGGFEGRVDGFILAKRQPLFRQAKLFLLLSGQI